MNEFLTYLEPWIVVLYLLLGFPVTGFFYRWYFKRVLDDDTECLFACWLCTRQRISNEIGTSIYEYRTPQQMWDIHIYRRVIWSVLVCLLWGPLLVIIVLGLTGAGTGYRLFVIFLTIGKGLAKLRFIPTGIEHLWLGDELQKLTKERSKL